MILSAIATDDRHPLRSCYIYKNAANCRTIRSAILYNQGGGGVGKSTAHAHETMFDPLPVGQEACRVRT